jgi:hypothetical protein
VSLDEYVRITLALAGAGSQRAELLAKAGLTEDEWQAIDDAWQQRIDEATDAIDDSGGFPPLLAEYALAMDRAQTDQGSALPFERFVQATLALRAAGDVAGVLRRLGLTMDEYMRASRHWTKRMIGDEELARAFRRALG